MNRRVFAAFLAAAALDPERLIWKPGKLISIPKPAPLPAIFRVLPDGHVIEWIPRAVNFHPCVVGYWQQVLSAAVAEKCLTMWQIGNAELPKTNPQGRLFFMQAAGARL